MSHSVRARLFVEKFLQDEGAEASDLFKCDLENAIEDLLTAVTDEAKEELEARHKPLVWLKPKSDLLTMTMTTLRPSTLETAMGRISAEA